MFSFSIELLCVRNDRSLTSFRVGNIYPTFPLTWRQVGRIIDTLEHRAIAALPGRIDAEVIGEDITSIITNIGHFERGDERFCEGVLKAIIRVSRPASETPEDTFRYGQDGGLDALYSFLLIP